HRRPERDGRRAAAASVARHLRFARRDRDARNHRRAGRAAAARGRPRHVGVLLGSARARAVGREARARGGGGRAHRAREPTGAYAFAVSTFPTTRLRRLRRRGALRDLVRETTLSLDDLVQPLFVAPEALPNDRLPALARVTVDGAVRECED